MKTTVYAPGMRYYVSSKDFDNREENDLDTEMSSNIGDPQDYARGGSTVASDYQ